MEIRERTDPGDRFNLVYIIFLLHGIGVLLPWNMFITAKSYFVDYKLNSLTEPTMVTIVGPTTNFSSINETTFSSYSNDTTTVVPPVNMLNDYQISFMSTIGVAANIPNVLFNGINLFVSNRGGNMKNRITAMILVECMIFLVTIVMVFIETASWISSFYYFTLMTVVIMNMANGVYQSSVYGLAANLPMSYSNAIILGNNLCGTLVSFISIISKATSADPKGSAITYFSGTLGVLILCLITIHLLRVNKYYRHFEQLASSRENSGEFKVDPNECTSKLQIYKEVFKETWPQFLNVFMVFFVTLAIFPAVHSEVASSGQMSFLGNYFVDVTCFVVFNLCAVLGTLLPGWIKYPGPKHLWIPVFARLLLFPFFIFCNFSPLLRTIPVYINNDWVYLTGAIILGVSSGYYSALAMMYAPKSVRPELSEPAAMLAAFFLVSGVFVGCYFSFVLRAIATA